MSKQKVRVESASVDIENGPHPQAEAPEGSAVSDRVQELQVVFRQLMHDYTAVLGQATALGRFKAGDIPTESTTPSGELGGGNHGALFLPLLRLMAGAHVRKQLDAVAARFAQIRSTLDPETEAGDRSWLGHARDEAVEIASHLPSLRIPGVFVVIPFILGLGTGLGKVATGVDGAVWFVIGVVIFFLGFLAYRDTRDAFRVKRELFLPGAATVDRLPAEEQQDHEGINVYRDEQTLFRALGAGRSPESAIDSTVLLLFVFLFAEFSFMAPLLLGDSAPPEASIAGLVLGFGALFANVIFERRAPKRVWR